MFPFLPLVYNRRPPRERRRGAAAKLIGAKKPSPLAYPRPPLSAADKLRPIAVSRLEREAMENGGGLLSFTNHMLVTRTPQTISQPNSCDYSEKDVDDPIPRNVPGQLRSLN